MSQNYNNISRKKKRVRSSHRNYTPMNIYNHSRLSHPIRKILKIKDRPLLRHMHPVILQHSTNISISPTDNISINTGQKKERGTYYPSSHPPPQPATQAWASQPPAQNGYRSADSIHRSPRTRRRLCGSISCIFCRQMSTLVSLQPSSRRVDLCLSEENVMRERGIPSQGTWQEHAIRSRSGILRSRTICGLSFFIE